MLPTRLRSESRESSPVVSSADPITSGPTADSGSFAATSDSVLGVHEEGHAAGAVVLAIEVVVEGADMTAIGDDDDVEEGGTIDAVIPSVDVAVRAAKDIVVGDDAAAEGTSVAMVPFASIHAGSIDSIADSSSSLVRNTHHVNS
ncbi:hypothetical protein V6N12_051126 [Hibiscus sabdariffa]|uniref:Uncharacterized protein n=1 Tax=Hibiscus sabdariffa TaxID=183260 RepID=A0ABR2GEF9_9ROSI